MKSSSVKVELLGQDSFQNVQSFSISYATRDTVEGTAKMQQQMAKKSLQQMQVKFSKWLQNELHNFIQNQICGFEIGLCL